MHQQDEAHAALEHALKTPQLYRPNRAERPPVDRTEMLKFLGYSGQTITTDLQERIDAVVADVEEHFIPKGVFRLFPVDANRLDTNGQPAIHLCKSTIELQGRDIFRHLKDATYCAVLACTLGMESERRLRTMGSATPVESAVLDAACSAAAESAIEAMDKRVQALAAQAGMKTNWRFSCGYGDCPLEVQPVLVASLNATRLIGLNVSATNLLLPSKSVTAMIGLFKGDVADASTRPSCDGCRLRTSCPFRARKTRCYAPIKRDVSTC
ncbi:hypothetical protein KPC83_01445 [Collinsella sp. zg1085]|nr:hypothetical protein KPC83_01445 [Collinsella sp. zg1085]